MNMTIEPEGKLQSSYRSKLTIFWTGGGLAAGVIILTGGVTTSFANLVFVVFVIPFWLNAWRYHRLAVEYDKFGLVVRRFRLQRIRWMDIKQIHALSTAGNRHAVVALRDGSCVLLPVPCDLGPLKEAEFDCKIAMLQEWLSLHREIT